MEESFLYSIGHGTRKSEEFVSLLKNYKIEFLIDVRTMPFSRFNPQFNQKKLNELLGEHSIRYVFMGDTLGGRPKDPECYTDGKINYHILQQQDYYQAGIKRLITAYNNKVPAAIMCSEKKPQDCHRSKLIGVTLLQQAINLKHIDELGKIKHQDAL